MTRFLVVFDVDSTLIEDEVIELLADRAGALAEVAEVTERAMRGEIDFAESLRIRVSKLVGLPESVLSEVSAELRPTPGAQELVAAIQKRGGRAAAVSGGFSQLLGPVRQHLKLDYALANTLELVNGKLTGRVIGDVIDAAAKATALRFWASELSLKTHQTIAVGDGANDLEMMKIAGLAIAFDAKPVVRAQAHLSLTERNLSRLIQLLP